MKDRFSLHIDNGQVDNREAVTVLRNGGTNSQPGLVGITNANYADGQDPILPESIFNVQSTGDSNVRFSSGPSKFVRSSLELLGNGNTRASGLHISYDPELDDAFIESVEVYGGSEPCVEPNVSDNTVVDFSLIRPSGTVGMEFSHLSISERGYVSMGLTRADSERKFHPNAPLTIAYDCEGHQDSGTISIHEQSTSPVVHSGFGKIYAKPYSVGGRSMALFFKDDNDVETNLVLNEDLNPVSTTGSLIFADNGNTYGGWYTPAVRSADATKSNNTYYGWGAGFNLGGAGAVACNTLIGYKAGSGLLPSVASDNTVIGCNSLAGFTSATNNVVVGHDNVNGGGGSTGGMDDAIVIGASLYQNSVPQDGTLAIGISDPLILGQLTGAKNVSVMNATFSMLHSSEGEFKISNEYDNTYNRFTSLVSIFDPSQGGANYAENDLEYRFVNDDGLEMTMWTLDPRGGPMTNSPSYEVPASTTPFAKLDADLKLRGSIRFQDGTSLSGLSEFSLIPLNGTSGTDLRVQGNENWITLDFSNLDLAGNIATEIRTDNTFIAAQVDGSGSTKVGKISLQGLADYVSSGASSIAENCNVLISNPENELNVNTAGVSRTVMIGCDVAAGASGWHHGVIIGSEAGMNATVTNPGFSSDNAVVFIGHRAGYDCDNLENTIAIGTNAGNNADTANDSIFIGSNAGLAANYKNSVGLGEHALRGTAGIAEIGSGNLEIVTGIDDNDRLMYQMTGLNDRFNIMNTVAGRRDVCNVSIGKPRLSPTAPLEVRRDSAIHGSNPNNYVQAWYCDDVLVANIDCDGNFNVGSETLSNNIEGIMDAAITGGSMASPASGLMSIYEDGVDTGVNAYITNRDSSMTGVPLGSFVVAARLRSEYRPIWVSCP